MEFAKARLGARSFSSALLAATLLACAPAAPVQPAGAPVPAAGAATAATAATSPTQAGGATATAAEANLITGRVSENGALVADAEVKILRMGSREALGTVRTGADGTYSFSPPASLPQGAMIQVLVTDDARRLTSAAQVGGLVAAGAGNLVAAGAGNMVSPGSGNMIAAGAGNYRLQARTQADVTRETTYAVAAFFKALVAADRAMVGREDDPAAEQEAKTLVEKAFEAFNRLAATVSPPPTEDGEDDSFVGTIFMPDGTPGDLTGEDGPLAKFLDDLKEQAEDLGVGLLLPEGPEEPAPTAPQGTVADTTDTSSGSSDGGTDIRTRLINVIIDAPVDGTFGLLAKMSTAAHRWVAADVFEYRLLVDCDESADQTFVCAQKGDAVVTSAEFTVKRTEAEPVITLQAWGNQGGTAATIQLNADAPTVFQPTPADEDVGGRTIHLKALLDATPFLGGVSMPIATPTGGGFSNPAAPIPTTSPNDDK